jgi:GNAT superfamily N-acetyltransferase
VPGSEHAVHRYAERPDLLSRRDELGQGFPEFMYHNTMGIRYWRFLYERFPAFQLVLAAEEGDELLAEAHAVPIHWDGSVSGLPDGWDSAFERGMTDAAAPTALCALSISVAPAHRGRRLSYRMLAELRSAATESGFGALVAPVRPSAKHRYPLIEIGRYASWRRSDGTSFDPWLRVHEALGGEIARMAPESLVIESPVEEWQRWTGLEFPGDGTHIVPGALAPLVVANGSGRHAEPNVWVVHRPG